MKQVYDYERDQWVWRKDASELAYERAARQEIDRVWNLQKFRRADGESFYYGSAYDRDKNFRNFR